MLKTFALRQRERPLTIHGPIGLRRLLELLGPVIGRLTFELVLVELAPNDELARDGYRIAAFATEHVPGGLGFAVVEDPRPGEFDPLRARDLGLTPGPDFGRLQRGEVVDGVLPEQVMGEPRRGRKVVLTGDTAPCDMTRLVAWEADLLVHEATFADDEADRAAETAHSTARQAGELRDEARAAFGGPAERVIVPRDFDRVEIPFPERGEPVHVRASERPPQPLAPEPAP
jgi:ribonuclease Z